MARERIRKPLKEGISASSIIQDMKAMHSNIEVLNQKMQYIVRNEKILGRNLIVLNKKIQAISQGKTFSPSLPQVSGDLEEQISMLNDSVLELKESVEELKKSQEEVKKLKYIVDAMNPLDLVSRSELEKLLKKKK